MSRENLRQIDTRIEVERTESLRQIGLGVPPGEAVLVPTTMLPTFENAVSALQNIDLSQPLQRPLTMAERGSLTNLQALGAVDERLANVVWQENLELLRAQLPEVRSSARLLAVPSRVQLSETQASSAAVPGVVGTPGSRTDPRSSHSRQETQGGAVGGGGQPPVRPTVPERRNIWRRIRESDYYPQSLRSATWLASTATSAFWSAATTLRAHKALENPDADKFYVATSLIETYPITYAFWRAYVLENRSVKQKAAKPNPIRGDEQV